MLKQRGIKAMIISLLVILSSTCFSLLFVNAYTGLTKQETPQAANPIMDLYDFKDFQEFMQAVKDGNTYEGLTVNMWQDIDCEGNTISVGGGNVYYTEMENPSDSKIPRFNGIFNGNGYSLSNFKLEQALYWKHYGSQNSSTENKYRGLFVTGDDAIIKNVEFSEFEFYSETTWENNYNYGIVCYGEGLLESCIISNITLTKGWYNLDAYLTKKAENCLLKSIKSHASGVTLHFAFTTTNCISYVSYIGMGNTTNSFTSEDEAYNDMTGVTSGTSSSDGAWYKFPEELQEDWKIYLRAFILWRAFTFNNGSMAIIKHCPMVSEDKQVSLIEEYLGTTTMYFYATDEYIEASKTGHVITSWEKGNSNYQYKAEFEKESYTINFNLPTLSGESISGNINPTKVVVEYGDDILVNETSNTSNNVLAYTIGSKIVTYTLNLKYGIDSWGLIGSITIGNNLKVPDLGSNGATTTVTPTLKYVTCTLTFGTVTGVTRPTTYQYTVLRGTNVTSSTSGYTFKTFNITTQTESTNPITVSYEVEDLYTITGSGWTSGNAVISDSTTITPTVEQTYIYVQFNTTTGSHTATLSSGTNKYIITLENYSTVIGTGTLSGGTLTYTFTVKGGDSQTVTYTNIPDVHIKTSDGIYKTSDTLVTVTPVLSQKYIYVEFADTEIEEHTAEFTSINNSSSIKIDKDSLGNTALNSHVISFTATIDGVSQTICTYTTLQNVYQFNDINKNSGNSERIIVTPLLTAIYKTLTFNTTTGELEINPNNGYVNVITYNVLYNTVIAGSDVVSEQLSYTFTLINGNSTTVTYTGITELYDKETDGIVSEGNTITVTPRIRQVNIYVEFFSTSGDYVTAINEMTNRYLVAYNNGNPTLTFSETTNLLTDNTLTYRFTDISSGETSVTYTIPCVYTTRDNKTISEDNTTITVAPITEQKYMIIEFKATTGSLEVEPSSPNQYRVNYEESREYNITANFTNGGLLGHSITYKYNSSNLSTYEIPAESAVHSYKTETQFQTETKITITPELEQKYVFLEFKPTTGDLEVNSTATSKFLINKSTWNTNLECTDEILTNSKIYYTFTDYSSTPQTVDYEGIPNIYSLFAEGITEENEELIEVTPALEDSYVNVEFKAISINKRTYNPSETTFLIDKDSLSDCISEYTTETKLKYKGKLNGEDIDLATYPGVELIYWFSETEITKEYLDSGVLNKLIVTPVLVQTYIYVQFNNAEINETEFQPKEGQTFMILYHSGNYVIDSEYEDHGIEDACIIYTLNTNEKVVTYPISAAYTLKDAGIVLTDAENITITPELEQSYILVTFAKTEGQATIAPTGGEVTLKVMYNSGDYISNGDINWTNCTLSYTVILSDGEQKTIVYEIEVYEPYTFDEEYEPDEKPNVAEITVSPELVIKEYDLDYGEIVIT